MREFGKQLEAALEVQDAPCTDLGNQTAVPQ